MGKSNFAVFVDLENAGGKESMLRSIIEKVKIRGDILLGKVYGQLRLRHNEGREVSTAVLEGLNQEEMSHIALIVQRQQNPINDQAFADCIRTVCREHQASQVKDEKDLQAFANRMRERKGLK